LEKHRYDWLLVRQRILVDHPLLTYDVLQPTLPSCVHTLSNGHVQQRFFKRYEHLIRTAKTELILVYVALLETQIAQDRTQLEHLTNTMWQYQRSTSMIANDTDANRWIEIIAMHQQQIQARWQYFFEFTLDHYFRHKYARSNASHSLGPFERLGFRSNLTIDPSLSTVRHVFTHEELKLLNRGPSYVSPCQLHLAQQDRPSTDRLVSKRYASMQHQLAHLFQEHRLNLAQSTHFQHTNRQAFQRLFTLPLATDVYRRAAYEHSLTITIRQRLHEQQWILRRWADGSNQFYLGCRSTFEQRCRRYMEQHMTMVERVYDLAQHSDAQIRAHLRTRSQTFNRTLDQLGTEKRLPVSIVKRLQGNVDRIQLGRLEFLPSMPLALISQEIDVQPLFHPSSCLTYRLGNYLSRFLQPLVIKAMRSTHFLNAMDFLERFIDFCSTQQRLRPTTLLVTITLKHRTSASIYHASLLESFDFFLFDQLATNKYQDVSIPTLRRLTELYLNNQQFIFDKQIYRFVRGYPSHVRFSQLLNHIQVFLWQRHIFDDARVHDAFIGRYHDQIFLTWNRSIDELRQWFDQLRHEQDQFDFHVRTSSDTSSFSFLNIHMENRHGHLYTRSMHRIDDTDHSWTSASTLSDAIGPDVVLPYVSTDPLSQHRQWLRIAFVRMVQLCSEQDDFDWQRRRLEFRCLTHGYTHAFIDREVTSFLNRFHLNPVHRYRVMSSSIYQRLRQQALACIDDERHALEQRWQYDQSDRRWTFSYLYDYGSRTQFREHFIRLWQQSFNDHPHLAANKNRFLLHAKYLFTLNTWFNSIGSMLLDHVA
jgi:hypothetical protein